MSTGAERMWIPYAGVAVVVLVLAVVFFFAPVPDIQTEDDYHIGKNAEADEVSPKADRQVARLPVFFLLWFNTAVLIGIFGMFLWLILSAFNLGPHLVHVASLISYPSNMRITADNSLLVVLFAAGCLAFLVAAVILMPITRKLSHHSIWSHPHFSGAVLAQFFYVAAQAGIFSFVINYVVWEVPPLPTSWRADVTGGAKGKESLIEVRTRIDKSDIKDLSSLAAKLERKSDAVSAFLSSRLSSNTAQALAEYDNSASDYALRFQLARDLEEIVTQDLRNAKEKKPSLYDEARFSGVRLQERTRQLLAQNPTGIDRCRLNRMLLEDAYPKELPFQDGILCFTNRAASFLAVLGFICFLTGRFTGAGLLRRFSAHKIVGLYGTLNVLVCLLVFFKLGWLSVVCVFLSYFFMSIMFPTIFALGIFGLGERAKWASAFIVMAIMGGAMLPKLMGAVADRYDMSRGFIVPMACFVLIALYGYLWPKLSKAESLHELPASDSH
jgi:fucose permease